jgi:hypothetical protein
MKPREIIDRPVNASITGIKGLIPSVMTIYGN